MLLGRRTRWVFAVVAVAACLSGCGSGDTDDKPTPWSFQPADVGGNVGKADVGTDGGSDTGGESPDVDGLTKRELCQRACQNIEQNCGQLSSPECVSGCQRAAERETIVCILRARTCREIQDCSPPVEERPPSTDAAPIVIDGGQGG